MMNQDFSIEEAKEFFGELFLGVHHIPGKIKDWGFNGWYVTYYGDLSTFDFNTLTRLVLLAHKFRMRVEITSGGPRRVNIAVHKRTKEGNISTRHPGLEDLAKDIQKMLGVEVKI
jgi:hypothetical protein